LLGEMLEGPLAISSSPNSVYLSNEVATMSVSYFQNKSNWRLRCHEYSHLVPWLSRISWVSMIRFLASNIRIKFASCLLYISFF